MDESIIDFAEIDFDQIVADQAEICQYNAQRHEMQQLDAVVFADKDRGICVGYKDVSDREFWVRGHMPGNPMMPTVLMCEAAAQLASFFVSKYDLLGTSLIGLGGMKNIRIIRSVFPGQRLLLALKQTRVRRGALIVCRFQGFVDQLPAIEGEIVGVPLPAP